MRALSLPSIGILLLCLLWPSFAVSATVTPTDVYAEVGLFARQLERVRFHMGAPRITPLELSIENAQPHDVYFLAIKLYEKSGRLLFQVTRKSPPELETATGVFSPADVRKLIIAARGNLALVLDALGLDAPVSEADSVEVDIKEPSDVFLAILAVNRQINTLLERRFSPSDVFEEVTLAIGYAAILIAENPKLDRIPASQAAPPGRVPSDVFFRLLESLDKIKLLYGNEGLESLAVDAESTSRETITPSDVFDIASLVVSRLDYLHKYRSLDVLPREPYYPGRVYPTDVYQHVGVLLAQLDTLMVDAGGVTTN